MCESGCRVWGKRGIGEKIVCVMEGRFGTECQILVSRYLTRFCKFQDCI